MCKTPLPHLSEPSIEEFIVSTELSPKFDVLELLNNNRNLENTNVIHLDLTHRKANFVIYIHKSICFLLAIAN
jgi:hypothetical protein